MGSSIKRRFDRHLDELKSLKSLNGQISIKGYTLKLNKLELDIVNNGQDLHIVGVVTIGNNDTLIDTTVSIDNAKEYLDEFFKLAKRGKL